MIGTMTCDDEGSSLQLLRQLAQPTLHRNRATRNINCSATNGYNDQAPPGGIVIMRVRLSVGWLVGSFVRYARCYFSTSTSPISMKCGTDVQHHKVRNF